MYINIEVVIALMQYIKSKPTVTFNEVISTMTTMGYITQVATLWLESFIRSSFMYGIIVEDSFDLFKQKSIESDISFGIKVAEVVEMGLIKEPIYYLIDNIAYSLLTKEEIYLDKLEKDILDLQKQINNIPETKTEPDQETLNLWNAQYIVFDKEGVEERLKEKKDLLKNLKVL